MDFFKLLERYYGFDLKKAGKVVFVRHQLMDYEHDFASDIVKHIGEYACIQRKENPPKNNKPSPNHGARFWGCNTVVSFCYPKFYGETGRHARFVGIFRNQAATCRNRTLKNFALATFGTYRNIPRADLKPTLLVLTSQNPCFGMCGCDYIKARVCPKLVLPPLDCGQAHWHQDTCVVAFATQSTTTDSGHTFCKS